MKNTDDDSTPEGSWWKKWTGDLEETLRDWGLGDRWEEFNRQAQAKLDELKNNPELKARWEEWNSRMDEWQAILREKFVAYLDVSEAQQWLDENTQRVRRLFEDVSLRDFVFEPFKEVLCSASLRLFSIKDVKYVFLFDFLSKVLVYEVVLTA